MVDDCVRLDVGVAEHAFDITCIYLNYKVVDADEIEVLCPEHVEESVELEFGL